VTDSFWEWIPVDIAVRAHWARASLDISQTINNSSTANQNVNAKIEVDNTVWGMNASVGHTFFGVIEPYAGFGFLKAKGEAKVVGTTNATIFVGTGFSGLTTSASSSPSSVALFGGIQFHLFVVNISAEAMRAFGTNNYTAKFSFDF
jgi:opacity protein-like surface antigen